ncbi:hypothetical protein PR048_025982 [Dryococelus australis]|uniref:Reverse transcriptase domain-containing protein n=1 Tax=Dryococelus australis TaxID=614101 RepID=A0ABQ9GK42_9NEOP|nr:hypothetical protein PR048_025982 [Dryococelus australis]
MRIRKKDGGRWREEQHDFREGTSLTDPIFAVLQLIEKRYQNGKGIVVSMEVENAYDSVFGSKVVEDRRVVHDMKAMAFAADTIWSEKEEIQIQQDAWNGEMRKCGLWNEVQYL